jgi:hypothetical protein
MGFIIFPSHQQEDGSYENKLGAIGSRGRPQIHAHAPDSKKVGLIAAILTKMTEQRIAMDARKAKMQEEMMKHMMQHMQMGKESMSQCPMMKEMKDMKGMDEKTGDTPKEKK